MIARTPEARARIRQQSLERLRAGSTARRRRRLADMGITNVSRQKRKAG